VGEQVQQLGHFGLEGKRLFGRHGEEKKEALEVRSS
jgi:hypothetical protein